MNSTFDGIFFLSMATLVCGGVGLLIKTCYKIKCSEVSCCFNFISFKRDIDEEVRVDIEGQERNIQQKRSSLSLGFNKI